METTEIIDVTIIEPRRKHPHIFERFDRLSPGESVIISNDHDPKPLLYQMLAERGAVIDWTYVERGPERWVVMITKKENAEGETIGELVTKDLRRASVFRKYGIDFCCGGKKTLSKVCRDKNINETAVREDLANIGISQAGAAAKADEWSLTFLADYIVNVHHEYVRRQVPNILAWSEKVARVHGTAHPETINIYEFFQAVAEELGAHMIKEEQVLFPFIRQMEQAASSGSEAAVPSFRTVANPIRMMEHEHETVGELLTEIDKISNNLTPPENACNTFRALYAALKEFEDDLFLHIHLENNILFPKAEQLERELR